MSSLQKLLIIFKKKILRRKKQVVLKGGDSKGPAKAERLNKLLASNWTFATSYIRDVLVKEMLIKILQEHRSLDYERANNICVNPRCLS